MTRYFERRLLLALAFFVGIVWASYAYGREFKPVVLSTGSNPTNLICPALDDEPDPCPECEACEECQPCTTFSGVSIVVAQGQELAPGRYRILFTGTSATFDVLTARPLGPGTHRIQRVGDVPSKECPVGMPLDLRGKVASGGADNFRAASREGVFVEGVLSCQQVEVYP